MQLTVPVFLAFGDHIAKGNLETGGRRFLDLLNSTDSLLTIEVAEISRLHDSQPFKRLQHLVICKERIVFGIPLVSQHEAPAKRAISHTKKQKYEAFVTAGRYELSGMLHQTKSESEAGFLQTAGQFFPLTGVTINTGVDDTMDAFVALVQTSHVNLLQIASRHGDTESISAKIRELLTEG